MAEKEIVCSSSIQSTGFFSFSDFYKFCYDWLTEETELETFSEDKYKERLTGDAKDIEIKWTGAREVTDYFKFEVEVVLDIKKLREVEITQNGKKVKTNQGRVKMSVKGILIRDYKGKFERSALQKFMRGIYEKWVIPSRIEQFEAKLAEDCNEFLNQAKAYLDLEGKKG